MKHLRAKTLFAAVSGLALVVPPILHQLGSEAAVSAEPAPPVAAVSEPPPLSLVATGTATAEVDRYDTRKVTAVNFGLYLRANGEPFELWAKRATYADPVRVQWRSSHGTVTLPGNVMPDFSGLRDFPEDRDHRHGWQGGRRLRRLHLRGRRLRVVCSRRNPGVERLALPIPLSRSPLHPGLRARDPGRLGRAPGPLSPHEAATRPLHRARGDRALNAGDSPLVIEGFREEGEDQMTAYQYFYDADGKETGHQQVGELRFHGANAHRRVVVAPVGIVREGR